MPSTELRVVDACQILELAGAGPQQQANDPDITSNQRPVQSCAAVVVCRIRVRTCFKQHSDNLEMTCATCPHQSCETRVTCKVQVGACRRSKWTIWTCLSLDALIKAVWRLRSTLAPAFSSKRTISTQPLLPARSLSVPTPARSSR